MEKKGKAGKRIKIKDLPANLDISDQDVNQIWGGVQAFQTLGDAGPATERAKVKYMVVLRGRF